jgi:hypothetical protein
MKAAQVGLLKVMENLLLVIDRYRRIDWRNRVLDRGRVRNRYRRAGRLVRRGSAAENVAQAEPDNDDTDNSRTCDGNSFLCLQAHGDSSPIRLVRLFKQ